jgi:gp16 family phage-associated protein
MHQQFDPFENAEDPRPKQVQRSRRLAPLSAAEALRRMRDEGVTIKNWAEHNGFHRAIVYSVLSGRRKCLRGQSHEIAVALGLKV